MEITKAVFEREVPAWAVAGGEDSSVWAALQTHLSTARLLLREEFGPEVTPERDAAALHWVCVTAARLALAGADLVLTPTGFGVVSNQNLAPASRDRVAALSEALRREASDAHDLLALALAATAWAAAPEARRMARTLLWLPMLLRRYGVRTAEGREVYAEEARALAPGLEAASTELARIVSPELLDALTARQLGTATAADAPAYTLALEAARRYLAARLMARQYPRGPEEARRRLLALLEAREADLPEYAASRTYAAQQLPRYANRRDDPSFFF